MEEGGKEVEGLHPGIEPAQGRKEMSPMKAKRRRRVSHTERKRELERELELLQSGVAVLQTRRMKVEPKARKDLALQAAIRKSAALIYAMQTRQLRLARLQSTLSRCVLEQQHSPLHSHIRLGLDPSERHATLLAMREEKLRKVVEFVLAPERLGDPLKPHYSEHRFENAGGDLCCVRYETLHFRGVQSLDQVLDALSFYKSNIEFIISDQLGHVALRDDHDFVDESAYNTRVLSTDQTGVTTEGNMVSFRHVFGKDGDHFLAEPCAILAADSVEEDELYPYLSSQRVRRDVSSGVVLTTSRTIPEEELVVTMRCATFITVRRPAFPIASHTFEGIYDGIMDWVDLMAKTVRGIVSPKE